MVKQKTDPRLIFLRARLSELEVAATAAVELGKIMTKLDDARMSTVNTWRWGLLSESVVDGRGGAGYSSMYCDGAPTPEYVLADVDAKLRILEMHSPAVVKRMSGGTYCATCGDPYGWDQTPPVPWPCPSFVELLRPFQTDISFEKEWLT